MIKVRDVTDFAINLDLDRLTSLEERFRDFFYKIKRLLESENYRDFKNEFCPNKIINILNEIYDHAHLVLKRLENSKSEFEDKIKDEKCKEYKKLQFLELTFSSNATIFTFRVGDVFGNKKISKYLLKLEKITKDGIEMSDMEGKYYKFDLEEFVETFNLISFQARYSEEK